MEIEAIEFDLSGNKKWEFQYLDKDWTGKYYPFPADQYFSVVEFKDKSLLYRDMDGRPLMKLNNFTVYEQYIECSMNSLQREIYLTPKSLVVTEKMRKKGKIDRYFVRDKFDKNIFEVSKTSFNKAGSFYDKVSFMWSLQKSKSVVLSYNLKSLINASFTVPEIIKTVYPLEFYQQEELTIEQTKLNKIVKLIEQDGYTYVHGHNPHSHPTEDMFIDEESNQPITTAGY
jgi:hypothetical protein